MWPLDEHNVRLLDNVHPAAWVDPAPAGTYNMVVIGAGAGGLVTAAGCAGVGARVAIIEQHLYGGDCLNIGCVPSKALLACAHAAHAVRRVPHGSCPCHSCPLPMLTLADCLRLYVRCYRPVTLSSTASRVAR